MFACVTSVIYAVSVGNTSLSETRERLMEKKSKGKGQDNLISTVQQGFQRSLLKGWSFRLRSRAVRNWISIMTVFPDKTSLCESSFFSDRCGFI